MRELAEESAARVSGKQKFIIRDNRDDAVLDEVYAVDEAEAVQLGEEYCAESGIDREIDWDGFTVSQ